jgi:hypothetical protein
MVIPIQYMVLDGYTVKAAGRRIRRIGVRWDGPGRASAAPMSKNIQQHTILTKKQGTTDRCFLVAAE